MNDARLKQIADRHKTLTEELEALRRGPVDLGDLLIMLRQVNADCDFLLSRVDWMVKTTADSLARSGEALMGLKAAEADLAQLRAAAWRLLLGKADAEAISAHLVELIKVAGAPPAGVPNEHDAGCACWMCVLEVARH